MNSNKRTYVIPVVYQMWGTIDVEASSLEEAAKLATGPEYPLPMNADYLDDSIVVAWDSIPVHDDDVFTVNDINYLQTHR